MADVYIMVKGKEYRHTYSRNLREKLKKEGWKHIYSVHGWNMGASKV